MKVKQHPFSESSPWMPLIDAGLALAAYVLAYVLRYEVQLFARVELVNRAQFLPYLPYVAIFIVWLYFSYHGSGLYKHVRGRSWSEETYSVINGVTNATLVIMALSFIFQPLVFSRLMLVYVAVISIILLSGVRAVRRLLQVRWRALGKGMERVLIIGAGDVGQAVLRTMIARKELGYQPVGYLDEDADKGSVDLGRVKGLGGLDNMAVAMRENQVDLVVITLSWKHHERILKLVEICQQAGVETRVVPDVFQLNLRQVQIENLDGIPLLGVNGHVPLRGTNRFLKRAIDIGLIVIGAPLWLPLFALVALAIRLEGPGPVFYTQRRVGENGREFDMIKFRSMIPDAEKLRAQLVKDYNLDPRHPKLKDDPRITMVGRLLRRTSIDELPNVINVLRGQMSLVGPRPPTPDEVKLYESWHMQRLQIIPGITGLWQISGRSDVPFDEMCLLDIYYIENWSVKLDAQILMMTIPRVLLRHGAY
ncbi:MAG: sugar transferase [Chloroflexi bacterium]|nr:sugar transferase [Chloroflexota bacterium]